MPSFFAFLLVIFPPSIVFVQSTLLWTLLLVSCWIGMFILKMPFPSKLLFQVMTMVITAGRVCLDFSLLPTYCLQLPRQHLYTKVSQTPQIYLLLQYIDALDCQFSCLIKQIILPVLQGKTTESPTTPFANIQIQSISKSSMSKHPEADNSSQVCCLSSSLSAPLL